MNKKIDYEAFNQLHGNINYLSDLTPLSKNNRKCPTTAEEKIWKEVLMKRQTGYKFLRQKPINRFILDFYCSELNLAVEIDGGSHIKKKSYDQARDKFLKQIGINTIRFTNEEVINDIYIIKQKLAKLLPSLSREGNVPQQRDKGLG